MRRIARTRDRRRIFSTRRRKPDLRHRGNRIGVGRQLEITARIDLGLALLSLVALPGVSLTGEDIAAWCDCTHQAIHRIELRALWKIRTALMYRNPALWEELRTAFFDRQSPAVSRWHHHPTTRDPALLA